MVDIAGFSFGSIGGMVFQWGQSLFFWAAFIVIIFGVLLMALTWKRNKRFGIYYWYHEYDFTRC